MADGSGGQSAAIMARVMANVDVAMIGAVGGFIAAKLMDRNKNQGMGGF
jgi:hypothetical protein